MKRWLAFTALLALSSCRRETRPPDRTEPWLASASAAQSSSARPAARRVRYTLEKSRIEFELPARQATPRGRITSARGTLDVDLVNPSATTGSVEIDLTSLELFSGSENARDAAFTARALDWLELGRRAPEERREAGRIATFSVRALVSAVSSGSGEQGLRTGEWSARGELALHGVRAPTTVVVSLTVPSSADDEMGPPAELVIRSRRPLVVSLGTHDIRPRDDSAVLLPRENALVGDRVGREARVSFELVFVPQP